MWNGASQFYCGCRPIAFLVDQHKLLFWKKMTTSNNALVIAKLIQSQMFALASKYGIVQLLSYSFNSLKSNVLVHLLGLFLWFYVFTCLLFCTFSGMLHVLCSGLYLLMCCLTDVLNKYIRQWLAAIYRQVNLIQFALEYCLSQQFNRNAHSVCSASMVLENPFLAALNFGYLIMVFWAPYFGRFCLLLAELIC